MGHIGQQADPGIEPNSVGAGAKSRAPGFPRVAKENDADGKEVEKIFLEQGAPLDVEDCATRTVEGVGIPSSEAGVGAEGQLVFSVEIRAVLDSQPQLPAAASQL